jgi:hypothetical protein
MKTTLLAIAPPFNEEEFSAGSQKVFIGYVLDLFGKGYSNLSFMVGDNYSTNALGNIVGHSNDRLCQSSF